MALEEPVRDAINDVQALAAKPPQSGQDLVGELTQGVREVAAGISLQDAPLALLRVELWAVPRQWQHVCNQAARSFRAAWVTSLQCAEPVSKTRKTSRPVAACR